LRLLRNMALFFIDKQSIMFLSILLAKY